MTFVDLVYACGEKNSSNFIPLFDLDVLIQILSITFLEFKINQKKGFYVDLANSLSMAMQQEYCQWVP